MANSNSDNSNNRNNPQATFWDFLQQQQPGEAGAGVDHTTGPHHPPPFPPGFPFSSGQFDFTQTPGWPGNGQWNPWGGPFPGPWAHAYRGGHHGPDAAAEEGRPNDASSTTRDSSPDTMRATPDGSEVPSGEDAYQLPPHAGPPPPAGPPHPPPPPPPPHFGRHPFHGHGGHPFGPGRGRGRGGCPRGRGHRARPGPPPAPWDFQPMMQAFANHPWARVLRDYVDQAAAAVPRSSNEHEEDGEDTFTPPVDVFNTEKAYVLHFALPGASKEDVGVHWDPEKSSLTVAGVVYRPGDEELVRSLVTSERSVGMFERRIELPPAGSDKKEEVDGLGITAKMENGILVVTVPKMERDSWTEIHKIDVE